MNATATPDPGPATLVDCPLCSLPAPFEAGDDGLDCATCGVRLPLAADPAAVRALAVAA